MPAAFAKHDSATMRSKLLAVPIAFGAINTPADLVGHELVRMETIAIPGGAAEVIASPVQTTDVANGNRAIPAIGQHSDAIRAEFAS